MAVDSAPRSASRTADPDLKSAIGRLIRQARRQGASAGASSVAAPAPAPAPAFQWPDAKGPIPGERLIPAVYAPTVLIRSAALCAGGAVVWLVLTLMAAVKPILLPAVSAFGVVLLFGIVATVYATGPRARACYEEMGPALGKPLEIARYFLLGGLNLPMALVVILLTHRSDPTALVLLMALWAFVLAMLLSAETVILRLYEERAWRSAVRRLVRTEAERREQRLRTLALPPPGPRPSATPIASDRSDTLATVAPALGGGAEPPSTAATSPPAAPSPQISARRTV